MEAAANERILAEIFLIIRSRFCPDPIWRLKLREDCRPPRCWHCSKPEIAANLQRYLSTPVFGLHRRRSCGSRAGGALKNIFAIAAGAGDGLGLGDNSKAALVTRALAEMVRLGTKDGRRTANILRF